MTLNRKDDKIKNEKNEKNEESIDKNDNLKDKSKEVKKKNDSKLDENNKVQDENDKEIEKIVESQDKDEKLLHYIDPKKLKPHPKNVEIYGREEVDEELVESILEKGQLEPIVIDQNYRIVSGHRRWRALTKINEDNEGIKAICFLKPFESELDEKEALVEYNRQRKKVPLQIYQEVKLLDEIYVERAVQRRNAGLKSTVVPDPAQQEEMKIEVGRTIEKEVDATGVKRTQLIQLRHIGKRWDEKDKDAIKLMSKLNAGELSIDAAYKTLQLIDIGRSELPESSQAKYLVTQIEKGNTTPNKAEKQLKKYKEQKDNEIPKSRGKLPEGTFNIIVADPQDMDNARKMQITDAMNAALFLWATTKNLKERMELMEAWDFKLKTIGVWETGKSSGTWFNGDVEFLLLGTRGNLKPQEYKPEIIFSKDREASKNKSEVVYDMAEKMFPGEKYLDPFVANGRDSWGQPCFIDSHDEPQNNNEES